MRTRVVTGMTLLALVALVPEVYGQGPRPDGLWAGLGFGFGPSTSSEFTGSERWGAAGYGRIGGTLGQRVRLGAEVLVWGRKEAKANGLSPARGNLSLVALVYPSATGPVFLEAGAGLAFAALLRQAPLGGLTTHGANGLGLSAGAGADVRLGSWVAFTPNLDVLYQYFPTQHFPAGHDPSQYPSLANFVIVAALGLTFR